MRSKKLVLKATLCGVVFFMLTGQIAKIKSDTVAIPEKAQELLLKGKRKEAIDLLLGAKGVKPADEKRIATETDTFSILFLTENGQKTYELGESMSHSNAELAMVKYEEALAFEGENIQILQSMGQLFLRQKNCRQADKVAERGLALYAKSSRARILKLEALDCFETPELLTDALKAIRPEDEIKKHPVVKIFVARDLVRSGAIEAGVKILKELTAQKKVFPEAWFWRWKLDPLRGHLQSQFAEEYLKLCNSMSPRLKREYLQQGSICLHTDTVKAAREEGPDRDEVQGE
jgi:hypothetical protein